MRSASRTQLYNSRQPLFRSLTQPFKSIVVLLSSKSSPLALFIFPRQSFYSLCLPGVMKEASSLLPSFMPHWKWDLFSAGHSYRHKSANQTFWFASHRPVWVLLPKCQIIIIIFFLLDIFSLLCLILFYSTFQVAFQMLLNVSKDDSHPLSFHLLLQWVS